jgi:IS30 family transposase
VIEQTWHETARSLRMQNWGVADIGAALDLSHQTISRFLREDADNEALPASRGDEAMIKTHVYRTPRRVNKSKSEIDRLVFLYAKQRITRQEMMEGIKA